MFNRCVNQKFPTSLHVYKHSYTIFTDMFSMCLQTSLSMYVSRYVYTVYFVWINAKTIFEKYPCDKWWNVCTIVEDMFTPNVIPSKKCKLGEGDHFPVVLSRSYKYYEKLRGKCCKAMWSWNHFNSFWHYICFGKSIWYCHTRLHLGFLAKLRI